MQATLEAVDGRHLGGFFVQVIPRGIVLGKIIFVCSCGHKMHLNLYGWLHLVRGSAEMRDEVGTAIIMDNLDSMVS